MKIVNNFTVTIILSPNSVHTSLHPAGYTTTLILKVIALAHFLLMFIMNIF